MVLLILSVHVLTEDKDFLGPFQSQVHDVFVECSVA